MKTYFVFLILGSRCVLPIQKIKCSELNRFIQKNYNCNQTTNSYDFYQTFMMATPDLYLNLASN